MFSSISDHRFNGPSRTPEDDLKEEQFPQLDLSKVEFKQQAYTGETDEVKRKRLRRFSFTRGTLEMDNLFGGFAFKYLDELTSSQLTAYDSLLRENDTDLHNWFVRNDPMPDDLLLNEIIPMVRRFLESGEVMHVRDEYICAHG
jgi:antitoxin CptB